MIRVKAFGLKDIIRKFLFGLFIIFVAYIILYLLIYFINANSRSFAANIVEDNINSTMIYAKGDLNTKLIQNELGFNKRLSKSSLDISKDNSNEPMKIIIENNNNFDNIENKKYIETHEIKIWDRPKSYIATKLSSGKVQVGKTVITNYLKSDLDLNELQKVSNFTIKDNTSILIYHTHTSEAYSEMGKETNFRTTDDLYNVVAVGEVLKDNLLHNKFDVTHITTKHDTPSYNGAYKASLDSVEKIFKSKKYDIVIDLHRDALSGNLNFRPTAEINGETAAKLMFVVGTNGSGLKHDNWMENLKLALLIQNTAEEMYPGLFRGLTLSKSRYNQHICNGAFIIEVGATGNTLDEVKTSMKFLSNVLSALKK